HVRGRAGSVRVGQPLTPPGAGRVGVRLADPPLVADKSVPGTLSVQVGPVSPEITAATVSVSLQPVITSVSPATGAPGTPSLSVRALGAGLGGGPRVRFLPDNTPDSSLTGGHLSRS